MPYLNRISDFIFKNRADPLMHFLPDTAKY